MEKIAMELKEAQEIGKNHKLPDIIQGWDIPLEKVNRGDWPTVLESNLGFYLISNAGIPEFYESLGEIEELFSA